MTWKKLNTLGHKKKEFRYGGSVDQNVVLDQSGQPRIDATFFNAALKHFSGKTISGGFSQDNPLVGGFGEWVRDQNRE